MPVHENQAALANTKTKTGLAGKAGGRAEKIDTNATFPAGPGNAAYEPQVALGDVYNADWNTDTDTTP